MQSSNKGILKELNCIYITVENILYLSEIDENLKEITVSDVVKLALTEGGRRAWLYKNNLVKNEVSNENFIELSVTWTPKQAAQFLKV